MRNGCIGQYNRTIYDHTQKRITNSYAISMMKTNGSQIKSLNNPPFRIGFLFSIIVCPRNTVTNSLKFVIARYSHNVNTQPALYQSIELCKTVI